ncbi:MAG: hypothetical protein QM520_04365 [Gammaproteobacteria bacterium]|nr:hypothetical protein [Gammaproteobacteria bacterium]
MFKISLVGLTLWWCLGVVFIAGCQHSAPRTEEVVWEESDEDAFYVTTGTPSVQYVYDSPASTSTIGSSISGPQIVYNPNGIIPPIEYVVGGAPIYFEDQLATPYYPLYINTPGSCHCVVPVRYFRGSWYSYQGLLVHSGRMPLYIPPPVVVERWRGHEIRNLGKPYSFGTFHRQSGHWSVAPAPRTSHHWHLNNNPNFRLPPPAGFRGDPKLSPRGVQAIENRPPSHPIRPPDVRPAVPNAPVLKNQGQLPQPTVPVPHTQAPDPRRGHGVTNPTPNPPPNPPPNPKGREARPTQQTSPVAPSPPHVAPPKAQVNSPKEPDKGQP